MNAFDAHLFVPRPRRRSVFLLACLALVGTLVGCGDETAPATLEANENVAPNANDGESGEEGGSSTGDGAAVPERAPAAARTSDASPGLGLELVEVRVISPSTSSHQRLDAYAADPRTTSYSGSTPQLLLLVEATNLSGGVLDSCTPPVSFSMEVELRGSRGERNTSLLEAWWGETWTRYLLRPEPGGSGRWTSFNPCGTSLASRVWRPGDRRRFWVPSDFNVRNIGESILPEVDTQSIHARLSMSFLGLVEATDGRTAMQVRDKSLLYYERTGDVSVELELPGDLLTARLVDLDAGRGPGVLVGDRLFWNGPSGPATGLAAWTGPFAAPPSRPVPEAPPLPSTSEGPWSMQVTAIELVGWNDVPRLNRDRKLVRVSATISLDPAQIDSLARAGLDPERAADPAALLSAQTSARTAALRAFDCSALSVLTERRRIRARNATAIRTTCSTLSTIDRVEATWEMELDRYELPLALVYEVRSTAGTRRGYDIIASSRLFVRDPR